MKSSITTLIFSLVLLIGSSYMSAWTAPNSNPPSDNVAAPINTASGVQYKDGTFGANYIHSFTRLTTDGFIRSATELRAPRYCDENGANCFNASSVVGGGSGWTRDRLIVPNFTTGRTTYNGPVDVSAYDFIEVGMFHSGGGSEWYSHGRAAQSTLIPVIPNTRAAINASSESEDAIEHVRIDANLRITFESWGDGGGSFNRLAFVNGLTFNR